MISALAIVLGVVLGGAFIYLVNFLRKWYNAWKCVIKLPTPPMTNFVIGHSELLSTPENMFKLIRKWGREHYPLFYARVGHILMANIVNAEDMEVILTNRNHMKKSFIYELLHNWLGTGLLTSTGHKWQTRRKILTPAFHFNILREFVPVFNKGTASLVRALKENCHDPNLDVVPHVTKCTLRSIIETTMGTKLNLNDAIGVNYRRAVKNLCLIYEYRLFRPWLVNNFINFFTPGGHMERKYLRTLHDFTAKVVEERQRNVNSGEGSPSIKGLTMLDLMLKAKREEKIIDDGGITEEIDTFMFEGHDTIAASISVTLMLLACNKDAQRKILEEMEEVLGDIHKEPDYNDLQNLKYLERCIKESLRLYPSVYFVSRKLGEDLTTATGYRLLKDTIVNLFIIDMHYNPRVFPDPEKFDPDRFLPENCQKRHPFAYLPFSGGPRNCIGQKFALMQLKTVICGILANFDLEPIDTPETIVFKIDIILRTSNGKVRVKLIPKSK